MNEDVKRKGIFSLLKKYLPYMEGEKTKLYMSFVLSFLSTFLAVLPVIYIYIILAKVFASYPRFENLEIQNDLKILLFSYIINILVYFIALVLSHLVAFRVEIGIQSLSFKKILDKPLGYFDDSESGKIRKIINDGAAKTHGFIAHQLPDAFATMTSPIIMLIMMFFVNWRIGLVSLIPLALGIVPMPFSRSKKSMDFMKKYMASLENMSSESVEYVRGISVVKAFGQTVKSFTNFYDTIIYYRDMVYAYSVRMTPIMCLFLVFLKSTALFIIPFIILSLNSSNAFNLMLDFIFYLLITPKIGRIMMRSMYLQHNTLLSYKVIEDIETLLDYQELKYSTKDIELKESSIEFKNVSYSYNKDNNFAVKNVSFKINQGETFGIIGQSGSGKSTLLKLAARFFDADEGEIYISGVNIKDIPKEKLMKTISFVFQNTRLFSKSLRENIVMGSQEIDEKALERAIEISKSNDIIENLEKGLDTVIGKDGTYLSGGQIQRISLARAVYKDADINLLDEATAFTDPENEKQIQEALRDMRRGKTTLMIFHKLSQAKKVDKLILMENGSIIDEGSHDELIQKNKYYKNMYNEYKTSIDWSLKKEVKND